MCTAHKRLRSHVQKKEDEKQRVENQAYLMRLAAELNNVGAMLQQVGEKILPLELYHAALDTSLEACQMCTIPQGLSLSQFIDSDWSHTDRLEILLRGKDKLAGVPCNDSIQNCDKGQNLDRTQSDDVSNVEGHKTFLLDAALNAHCAEEKDCRFGSILAVILFNMGSAEYKEGKLEVSKRLLLAALSIRDEHTEGTWIISLLYNNLGHIYYSQGKNKDALIAFDNAYRIGLEACDLIDIKGEHEPVLAEERTFGTHQFPYILYNLGYTHVGDRQDTEFACECLRSSLCDASDPELIYQITRTMHRIGHIYHKQGSYDDALAVYKDILAVRETATSTNFFPTLKLLSNVLREMSYIHFKMEQYPKALADLDLSLNLMVAAVGLDNPLVSWLRLHNDQFLKKILQRIDSHEAAPAA